MAESLIDGTGSGYFARVNAEGRLLVDISGATINIGSVSANVDSIYVQSGVVVTDGTSPIDSLRNNSAYNFISGTSGEIGSIIQFIGAGSYVQVLTWEGGSVLTQIGSWT